MIDLSIVIVSWNVKPLLRECLASIFRHRDNLSIEVFVVDNASGDHTSAMVQKEYPQVKLIANQANLGFTKANNQAMIQALGKYIFILNPDTIIKKQALSILFEFMEENPQCGALGPRLLNADGSLQRSCRSFPNLATQLYSTIFLDGLLAKSKVFGKYMMSYWDHNDIREVDQPMGAALLCRKQALDQVGIFDENIIFWYDEVDLCYRLKKAGWKIYFTPNAQIIHYQGKSFKQWKGIKTSLRGAYLWRKSRNYFFKKHYGAWQVPLLIIMDILQIILVLIILYLALRSLIGVIL